MNGIHRLVIAGLACAAGSMALAEPTVVFSDGPGNTQGGIFHAVTSDRGTFDTFCVEVNEGISIGWTFEYTISTEILYNGNGTSDPLDARTAFIYTRFREGLIRDILGKPNMPEDKMADAIQLAMWKIEGEKNTTNPDALKLIDAATTAIGNGEWQGLGNVRVMNVWVEGHVGEEAYARQDTLIIVPLPSSAGLVSLGLLGLGVRRRR